MSRARRRLHLGLAVSVGAAAVVIATWVAFRGGHQLAIPGAPEAGALDAPSERLLERSTRAVTRDPSIGSSWGRLGMVYQAHELHEAARYCYGRAAELEPEEHRWPHLLGLVCQFLALPDDAAAAFSRSLKLDPDDVVALCSLARIRRERGETEQARDLYARAVAVDPACVAARVALGQLEARAGRLDAAEQHLLLALEILPRCRPAHATLAEIYSRHGESARAAYHRSWSLPASGDLPLPDPLMDEVQRFGVSYTARMRRGKLAGSLGRWQEAAAHFRAALALRETFVEPRYYLGVALLRAGEIDAGLAELDAVTGDAGRRVDALLHIARVHAHRGEMERAHAAVVEALRADPEHPEAHVTRARLLAAESKQELALAECDRALRLRPDHAEAHVARGEILLSSARGDAADAPGESGSSAARGALEAFERALDLEPDLADAHEGAGLALLHLSRGTAEPSETRSLLLRAAERFRELVTYFPERKSGHAHLIRTLYRAGDPAASLDALRRAHERWPEDPLFRKREESERGR